MRYVVVSILFGLALVGLLAVASSVTELPHAYALLHQEPEDVYLLVFWAVLGTFLSAFWLMAAVYRAFGVPKFIESLLRASAGVAIATGILFAVVSLWGGMDADLSMCLSIVCLFSGFVVLRQRSQVRRNPIR
jgi:hypothetical protein